MKSPLSRQMDLLRARYQQNLSEYRLQFSQLWEQLQKKPQADHLLELSNLAHRLAGSGKAYGFEQLSIIARDLEHVCVAIEVLDKKQMQATLTDPINAMLDCLIRDAQFDDNTLTPNDHSHVYLSPDYDLSKVTLLVVDDDTDFCAHLCNILKNHGYRVLSLNSIDSFEEYVELYEPQAAIVDMDFYGKRFAGANTVFAWRQRDGKPIPVIFISAFDSFELRLSAVQSGGNYFLNKPLDETRLFSLLNTELNLKPNEPFKVLLVDDDEDLLRLYESILKQAGYIVTTVSNAREALESLQHEAPDLVLIDVYMPMCNGIELGQLIRQHERFSHIPLLFMSAAADTDIKMACARLANDDFINKPVEPWRLIMIVKSRSILRRRQALSASVNRISEIDQQQDPLTALPSLRAFRQAVQARVNNLGSEELFAVIKLDIRDFHTVNNLYGYFTGDQVLQRLAWQFTECLSENDLLCRESGDEFLVLTSTTKNMDYATKIAESMIAAIEKPAFYDDRSMVALSADIGIAVAPQDAGDANDLLRCADTALFSARKSADAQICYFDASIQHLEQSRFNLSQEIKQAFNDDQFVVAYQPIFSISDGKLLGFEALARWLHPIRGQVGPVEFIPLMEEQGLMSLLTDKILEIALMQLAHWQVQSSSLFMSVNLSTRDIQNPIFISRLKSLIKQYNLAPDNIVLEITETVLLADWQRAANTISSLRALGVELALDDFGTGYSSLSYLNRIHASKLKIDRSFIHSWSETDDGRLLQSMIQLGHGMNMNVVAEGVETPDELDFLRKLGCDSYQGYLRAKPMFADEIILDDWLDAGG